MSSPTVAFELIPAYHVLAVNCYYVVCDECSWSICAHARMKGQNFGDEGRSTIVRTEVGIFGLDLSDRGGLILGSRTFLG